mmetsp:Transcript_80474/g.139670  ORF Transcript_80474/g.139670 Transcript_80474/m.139670 type:complete len:407 (-) Transcript_80474:47-1267(-)
MSTALLLSVIFRVFGQYSVPDELVFVGTGGCDGEDHACVEGPPEPERVIRPMLVKADGSMSIIGDKSESFPTGGNPVWLSTVGADLDKGCLFATLADKSMVFSAGFGSSASVASGGVNPVYSSVSHDGKTLLVANYHGPDDAKTSDGASVASFAIGSKCSLTLADVKNHSGSSIVPDRQGGAHVHSVVAARGGLAFACDLGMDKIFTYKVGPDSKLTELHQTPTAPGAGPRHLVQHPSLPFVYVVNEMGVSVTSYKLEDSGALVEVESESLIYDELGNAYSKAAEIAISPDGKFIFATNRMGQNTVTVFKTLPDGQFVRMSYVEAPAFPRGMALVAEGSILIVGGQSKTEVWSYSVGTDGSLKKLSELQPTGGEVDLPPHPATFTTFAAYSPLVELPVKRRQLFLF